MQLNIKKLWPTVIAFALISAAHVYSHDSPISDLEDDLPCPEQNLVTPNQEKPLPHFEQNLIKFDLENHLIPIEKQLENCLKIFEQTQDANGRINPAARPLIRNGWNFQVSANALFWKVQEDAFTYVIESSSDQDLGQSTTLVKQKYNWGFRVGLGWTLPHDNWDIAANWTHLISNNDRNKTAVTELKMPPQGNSSQLFSLVIEGIKEPIATSYSNARLRYHNRLDQISLNAAREFFISKWVVLRPYFGLRADWLHKRLCTDYSGNVVLASEEVIIPDLSLGVRQINKWQGTGIESGFSTQLSFCGGFSIYGNITVAIEYGYQKLYLAQADFSSTQFSASSNSTFNSFSINYHICRPILDLQLGLGWDYNFCKNRFHFGLKLGWENHVYFNQSRFLFLQAENAHVGDLTYQGWTLHASFDF